MTYFGFLASFIGVPLAILAGLAWGDHRSGRRLPDRLRALPAWVGIAAFAVLALVYTTPWDNYLVANRVWYYDRQRVTGLVFGWVPVEEYTFFIVQTLLVGLWFVFLARRLKLPEGTAPRRTLPVLVAAVALAWVGSLALLVLRWRPGTYLGLELAWFLPPILLQLAFGAGILWHYRRLVLSVLVSAVLYLSLADGIAIGAGVWTISPDASTGVHFSSLPLEEFIFFTLTSALIVFGMTLVLARESLAALPRWLRR